VYIPSEAKDQAHATSARKGAITMRLRREKRAEEVKEKALQVVAERHGMSAKAAGQLGGLATKGKYGEIHFKTAGKKGGQTIGHDEIYNAAKNFEEVALQEGILQKEVIIPIPRDGDIADMLREIWGRKEHFDAFIKVDTTGKFHVL